MALQHPINCHCCSTCCSECIAPLDCPIAYLLNTTGGSRFDTVYAPASSSEYILGSLSRHNGEAIFYFVNGCTAQDNLLGEAFYYEPILRRHAIRFGFSTSLDFSLGAIAGATAWYAVPFDPKDTGTGTGTGTLRYDCLDENITLYPVVGPNGGLIVGDAPSLKLVGSPPRRGYEVTAGVWPESVVLTRAKQHIIPIPHITAAPRSIPVPEYYTGTGTGTDIYTIHLSFNCGQSPTFLSANPYGFCGTDVTKDPAVTTLYLTHPAAGVLPLLKTDSIPPPFLPWAPILYGGPYWMTTNPVCSGSGDIYYAVGCTTGCNTPEITPCLNDFHHIGCWTMYALFRYDAHSPFSWGKCSHAISRTDEALDLEFSNSLGQSGILAPMGLPVGLLHKPWNAFGPRCPDWPVLDTPMFGKGGPSYFRVRVTE